MIKLSIKKLTKFTVACTILIVSFSGFCTFSSEMDNWAVVVIDFQGDFTHYKAGSLAIPGTDDSYVQDVIEKTLDLKSKGLTIIATQDWHPEGHISFYTTYLDKKPFDTILIDCKHHKEIEKSTLEKKIQVLWPPHCIQNKPGSELLFHEYPIADIIVQKGTHIIYDSYSGFEDDGGVETELHSLLQIKKIDHLITYGLATDFCVQATVLDALKRGYRVSLIHELCRGVNEVDCLASILKMQQEGAVVYPTLSDFWKNVSQV